MRVGVCCSKRIVRWLGGASAAAAILAIALAMPSLVAAAGEECGRPVKCREVQHFDGAIRFQIPADWVEDVSEDGYPIYLVGNKNDPAILSVSAQTFDQSPVTPAYGKAFLIKHGQVKNAEIAALPDGNSIKEMTEYFDLDGQRIEVHDWYVANLLPPDRIRLVVFIYTLPTAPQLREAARGNIDLLRASIWQAKFSNPAADE